MNWTPYQHIPVYRPPTNHLLTINHLPTDHLHVSTIYRPLTDHLPTIDRLTTDHLPGNAACNLHLVVCRFLWHVRVWTDTWVWAGKGPDASYIFWGFHSSMVTDPHLVHQVLSQWCTLIKCIFLQVIDRVNVPEDLENLWEQPWCCESTRQKVIMTYCSTQGILTGVGVCRQISRQFLMNILLEPLETL